ncbi:MAG: homoserine dehydrogenase [Lachnospiraceae bacterium]
MIQVAVFGYGTVGSGVVEVIEGNKAEINKKSGAELYIKYILDLREFPKDPYADRIVHDVEVILQDSDISVICETMGGIEPAYTFTKRALLSGKSVCTSNKELVATHGPELLKIARENNCNYLFEASVGGGIPIIRPLNYSLTAEKIEGITGILNGTTNYILTKMDKEGADFSDVLKEAQEKGYAEKNPEADVEGHDACRKIAILSSLMTGKNVNYNDIYTEGITKITATDFKYAKKLQKSIKLLAVSKETKEGYIAMVSPCMIDIEHPLYSVNDVYNAIFVRGNMLGDSMYYGRGAGKLPTASAVVSDVVDCARHIGKTIMCFWEEETVKLADVKQSEKQFFVRATVGTEETVKEKFGEVEFIHVVDGEFGFLTQVMTEEKFEEATKEFDGMITRIRVEA